jgi:Asp-tRNA(Asn)/Glu-tRNA(Gln) amidotransferase A subunit family amidase
MEGMSATGAGTGDRGMAESGLDLLEATIEDIQQGYNSGQFTCRGVVQFYLDRIAAYDKRGPAINSIITINGAALDEAERLDRAFKATGTVGPLHGIPVIVKDQADVKGLPTTLGSVLFKDFYPDRDSFVVEKLKQAGAVILAKSTLGEMAGGDTHGSLFGSTRNPYDLDRTVGGSSGGSAAAVTANLCAVAIGQEGLASIRRPAAWNCVAGMRTTAGLVSRAGVYAGWPSLAGSLGPITRTVADSAAILDVIAGYDPEDPLTAYGVGQAPASFKSFLHKDGLKGARLGILREPMGIDSEPDSDDFKKISEVFDNAVRELKEAGAAIIDPIVIPQLNELLAKRAAGPGDGEQSFKNYFGRSAGAPFRSSAEAVASPGFSKVSRNTQNRMRAAADPVKHFQYLIAREQLMSNLLKVMADHRLDAIVHKAVEHQPTLIAEGLKPPYVNYKGAPHLNTFLVFVPSVVVPAGFSRDNLPAGIVFLGRPYDDGNMIKFAYAYEQATHHRRPPKLTVP